MPRVHELSSTLILRFAMDANVMIGERGVDGLAPKRRHVAADAPLSGIDRTRHAASSLASDGTGEFTVAAGAIAAGEWQVKHLAAEAAGVRALF